MRLMVILRKVCERELLFRAVRLVECWTSVVGERTDDVRQTFDLQMVDSFTPVEREIQSTHQCVVTFCLFS